MGDEERDQPERLFSMEVKSISGRLNRKLSPVMIELMRNADLDIARYYLARAKLEGLNEKYGEWTALTLTWACEHGYLDIVEGLLSVGVDIDGVTWDGTPCNTGADKAKVCLYGMTAYDYATVSGHEEIAAITRLRGSKRPNLSHVYN